MAYALKLSDAEVGRYRMMAEHARADEADLWELAGIKAGARVADVGCGPGMVLAKLAEIVGPTGIAVGVDSDPAAVEAAVALLAATSAGNASAQVGWAHDTGLEAASFDVVVMRHVLAHNGGSEQKIVDHLRTLLKPGGALYIADIHAAGMAMRPESPIFGEVTRAYARFMSARGNDLSVGLRLRELLIAAGLNVEAYRGSYSIVNPPAGMRPPPWAARADMLAEGIVTEADIARWEWGLSQVDAQAERPTLFNALFIAVGRA